MGIKWCGETKKVECLYYTFGLSGGNPQGIWESESKLPQTSIYDGERPFKVKSQFRKENMTKVFGGIYANF